MLDEPLISTKQTKTFVCPCKMELKQIIRWFSIICNDISSTWFQINITKMQEISWKLQQKKNWWWPSTRFGLISQLDRKFHFFSSHFCSNFTEILHALSVLVSINSNRKCYWMSLTYPDRVFKSLSSLLFASSFPLMHTKCSWYIFFFIQTRIIFRHYIFISLLCDSYAIWLEIDSETKSKIF